MTRRGVVLVLLLAAPLLALASAASAQSGTDNLETASECAARLRAASGAGAGEGVPRLADVCADLAGEIASGAWASALGEIRAEELTSRPFEELVELIAYYERAPGETAPAVDELAAVVDSLRPFEPVAELSLWERLRAFIRERLGLDDPASNGGLLGWLRNLSIPEEWIRTIVYVLGITIVVAAVIVAANELRLSGMLGGDRGGAGGREKLGALPAWAKRVPLTFDGLRGAAPARQPALLLALLVERLRARFGDDVRDSLTHRELASIANARGVRRHSELDAVVSAAERVTFAGWRPDSADIEPVISNGKAVLDELEAGREPTASPR